MITFQYLSYGSKDLFDQDDTDQTLEPVLQKCAVFAKDERSHTCWSTRNELNCFDQIVVDFV